VITIFCDSFSFFGYAMFERFIVFLIVFSISVIILAFILSKFSYGLNCRQQTIYIKVL